MSSLRLFLDAHAWAFPLSRLTASRFGCFTSSGALCWVDSGFRCD